MRTNVAIWERWLRVALGVALIVAGVAVLRSGDTFGFRAGAFALATVGLDLAVTGAIGFCPLYHALGRRDALRDGPP